MMKVGWWWSQVVYMDSRFGNVVAYMKRIWCIQDGYNWMPSVFEDVQNDVIGTLISIVDKKVICREFCMWKYIILYIHLYRGDTYIYKWGGKWYYVECYERGGIVINSEEKHFWFDGATSGLTLSFHLLGMLFFYDCIDNFIIKRTNSVWFVIKSKLSLHGHTFQNESFKEKRSLFRCKIECKRAPFHFKGLISRRLLSEWYDDITLNLTRNRKLRLVVTINDRPFRERAFSFPLNQINIMIAQTILLLFLNQIELWGWLQDRTKKDLPVDNFLFDFKNISEIFSNPVWDFCNHQAYSRPRSLCFWAQGLPETSRQYCTEGFKEVNILSRGPSTMLHIMRRHY